jgi:NAD(P)-dependent dehydrogenase (short-subunit alcohol dehydrogenase family)
MAQAHLIAPYASVHANPQGPGDARPAALQIITDENLVNKWADKTVLITGGSSGIGIETVRALHATGAKIFITSRYIPKANAVRDNILRMCSSNSPIEIVNMELGSLDSVRSAAAEFLSRSKTLNLLVNDAGIMAAPYEKTKDRLESHFGINHLAHFLLASLLLPTLVYSSTPAFASRVINVSSRRHFAHNPGEHYF